MAITAFEARPGAGTEAGLAAQWARGYAKCGAEPVVITTVGKGISSAWSASGLSVIEIDTSGATSAPQKPADFYLRKRAYSAWATETARLLESRAAEFDLVHHVSWGSVRIAPPFSPNLRTPLVWGPLGGGQLASPFGLGLRGALHEAARAATFPYAFLAHKATNLAEDVRLCLVTNSETGKFAERIGLEPHMMLADGVPRDWIAAAPRESMSKHVRLLWLGRMVTSKRPDIPIHLVDALRSVGIPVSLKMAGDGPSRRNLEGLAERLGVSSSVSFIGRVPWNRTRDLYDEADLLVFSSFRDSSCPAVLEAAARGVPSLSIRHQGVGSMVPEVVAPGPPPSYFVSRMVDPLLEQVLGFMNNPLSYSYASEAAIEYAEGEVWEVKAARILAMAGEEVRDRRSGGPDHLRSR